MKKSIILITVTFINLLSHAQSKRDLIKEIDAYKSRVVSNAKNDKEFSEVWNAIYVISTEEYSTIARESESRGYIEAKQEKETFKEYMTVEILGNERPYKVSFQVRQERRTKKEDCSFTEWENYTSLTLRSYYSRLQSRLYELLNGPLQLSDALVAKIEAYNASQYKDRKKILKGRDY